MTDTSVIHLLSGREPFFESFDFDQVTTYEVKAQAGYCAIKRILETESETESAVYVVIGKGQAFPSGWLGTSAPFDDKKKAIEHFEYLYKAIRKVQILLY